MEEKYTNLVARLRNSQPNRRLMWTAADCIEELVGLLSTYTDSDKHPLESFPGIILCTSDEAKKC